MRVLWSLFHGLAGFLLFSSLCVAQGGTHGEPFLIKKNGGWCWFQDERVLLEEGMLIVGSVAGTTRDGSAAGDVEVTVFDLSSLEGSSSKLHPRLQADDHNAPAFLRLPDGRFLASYMTHGGHGTEVDTDLMLWRISEPGNPSSWLAEQSASVGATISYTNLFLLSSEDNRIYNFHRGIGWDPNWMVSNDLGRSFHYGGRLLIWSRPALSDPKHTGVDGSRPYVKYASNGRDEIHFVTTEDHPRAYDNSIYHGVLRGGKIHHSDGSLVSGRIGERSPAVSPLDLTPVYRGDRDHVAWTIDLHLDERGRPFTLFSIQRDGANSRGEREAGGEDHRYLRARWTGEEWLSEEISHAGTYLYDSERDYTGLGALDPRDPERVFISTDAHPKTGRPLISRGDGERHYEIYEGVRKAAESWVWKAITSDSTKDNLRPVVPISRGGATVLLWLRGEYSSYQKYDLDIYALVLPALD